MPGEMINGSFQQTTRTPGRNPYLFIVGCPRSGTTLLQRMVDAHPLIAVTHEQHWIPRYFNERIGLTPEGLVTPDLIPSLFEQRRFAISQLEMDREEIESLVPPDAPVLFSEFVTSLFDLYGERKGKRLVGDKTPGYVKELLTLHSLWPRARFIHIIRDGRDVCLSVMNWKKVNLVADRFVTWAEDPVSTTALYWKRHVQRGREAGRSLGPALYYEIRYESLVDDPAEESAKLCAFLEVPYDEAMLQFHEGRTRVDPGLDAKDAWRPVVAGLRDWRSQMPTEAVERFEAAAGELLDELDYPRTVPCPSPAVMKHAARIRDLFSQNPGPRRELLQKGV